MLFFLDVLQNVLQATFVLNASSFATFSSTHRKKYFVGNTTSGKGNTTKAEPGERRQPLLDAAVGCDCCDTDSNGHAAQGYGTART